jgi:hypothetical protein
MGTSKFADAVSAGPRTARALLYSGRPDPAWEVDAGTCRDLLQIWASLAPGGTRPATPASELGYRGVMIEDFAGASWVATAGVVTCRSTAVAETRCDRDRRFERRVLASAPSDLLPPAVRNGAVLE